MAYRLVHMTITLLIGSGQCMRHVEDYHYFHLSGARVVLKIYGPPSLKDRDSWVREYCSVYLRMALHEWKVSGPARFHFWFTHSLRISWTRCKFRDRRDKYNTTEMYNLSKCIKHINVSFFLIPNKCLIRPLRDIGYNSFTKCPMYLKKKCKYHY